MQEQRASSEGDFGSGMHRTYISSRKTVFYYEPQVSRPLMAISVAAAICFLIAIGAYASCLESATMFAAGAPTNRVAAAAATSDGGGGGSGRCCCCCGSSINGGRGDGYNVNGDDRYYDDDGDDGNERKEESSGRVESSGDDSQVLCVGHNEQYCVEDVSGEETASGGAATVSGSRLS